MKKYLFIVLALLLLLSGCSSNVTNNDNTTDGNPTNYSQSIIKGYLYLTTEENMVESYRDNWYYPATSTYMQDKLSPAAQTSILLKEKDIIAKVNAEGYFEFTNLEPGNYTLNIHEDNFDEYSLKVSVDEKKELLIGRDYPLELSTGWTTYQKNQRREGNVFSILTPPLQLDRLVDASVIQNIGNFVGQPIVIDDKVYIKSQYSGYRSYDIQLNKWRYLSKRGQESSGYTYGTPTLGDKYLYVAYDSFGTGNRVIAIDPNTDEIIWNTTTSLNGLGGRGSVAYHNGLVYSTTEYGVFALDGITGSIQWQRLDLGNMVSDVSIAVYNEDIIIAVRDGSIYSIKAATGDLNWKTTNLYPATVDTENLTGLAIDESGVIYCANKAIDAATGTVLWTAGLAELNSIYMASAPAIGNEYVFVQVMFSAAENYGYLYAINKSDGTVAWKSIKSETALATPLVTNGFVYAMQKKDNIVGGALRAFSIDTGELVWEYVMGNQYLGTPTVYNDNLYHVDHEGIYIFR